MKIRRGGGGGEEETVVMKIIMVMTVMVMTVNTTTTTSPSLSPPPSHSIRGNRMAVMKEEEEEEGKKMVLVKASPLSSPLSTPSSTPVEMNKMTVLRVAAETWQPYFLITTPAPGEPASNTQYSGIMWDLLLMLTAKLNVTVEMTKPPDGLWGVEMSNGSWNGMLGMIQRQAVDMAVGPFAVSYQRTKVADFPTSIFVLPHRVYLPRPKGTSDLSDFVRLYHPTVWALVLASVGVMAALVWASVRVEAALLSSSSSPYKGHESPSYIILHVWGGLMQESGLWGGLGVSRFLMGIWFLATLVLMNTYSGLLVASLTVPRVSVPIASVQQLVDQDALPWRLEQGGIILHTFKTADVRLYKTLLLGSDGLFPDCYAARNDIASGKFAGLCDTLAGDLMVAKSFSASGKCEFFSPRENVVTHSYTMVMQKNSPYKSLINFWLQELQERGWVDQLVRQRVNNGTICQLPPGKEGGQRPPTSLTLTQMWGVFAILGVGAAGAAVVFLLEVVARQDCLMASPLPLADQ